MIAKPLGGGGFLPTPRRQHVHVLSNGLTLVAEEMDNVRSVAFSVLVPSGASTDPEGLDGQSAILADMLARELSIKMRMRCQMLLKKSESRKATRQVWRFLRSLALCFQKV